MATQTEPELVAALQLDRKKAGAGMPTLVMNLDHTLDLVNQDKPQDF
ncbi:hypothetical protein [Pseudarthrobacter sp. NamE2]|nr:hypothetical protein [Pseudarthrobacter sp. NamE2]